MMAYSRQGTAHRLVALDLMLRTFMNSPDFQPYDPRMWEGIAKLVPGTTPQQCIQRWEELRSTSQFVTRDLSVLAAKGRPISASGQARLTSQIHYTKQDSYTSSVTELPPINDFTRSSNSSSSLGRSYYRDQYRGSISSPGGYRLQSGKFTASFCQSYLNGVRKGREINEGKEQLNKDDDSNKQSNDLVGSQGQESNQETNHELLNKSKQSDDNIFTVSSTTSQHNYTSSLHNQENKQEPITNMVIHVRDETKKKSQDFICPRETLIKEMRYFNDYLTSTETQQWEEVDISVHCDVSVFHWLMCYVKRGMTEGPIGEILDTPLEPLPLVPTNVVSILISSDFLKMDSLTEDCLIYCHRNMSEVTTAPCNMNCIGSHLMTRLVQMFSPLEVERLCDVKDKIKSKLFLHLLERLFDPSYSHPECPNNAATLFRCKHCGHLLTAAQVKLFPCSPQRLKIDKTGQLKHRHKRDPDWTVESYLISLRQTGMSWREIFWRIWGKITWFTCELCGQAFQCSSLSTCCYHPKTFVFVDSTGTKLPDGRGKYLCCDQIYGLFSPTDVKQNGCCFRDHIVSSNTINDITVDILTEMRDLICEINTTELTSQENAICAVLKNELKQQVQIFVKPELPQERNIVERKSSSNTSSAERRTSINAEPNLTLMTKEQPLIELQPSQEKTKDNRGLKNNGPSRKLVKGTRRQVEEEESSGTEEGEEEESSSSELEEDDEEGTAKRKASKIAQQLPQIKSNRSLKKTKVNRSKLSDRSISERDWIWDNSKPVRWNQDMQRSQDDFRISQLQQQLQQLASATESSNGHQHHSHKTVKDTQSYPGGIFARLEAQFRANMISRHTTSGTQFGIRIKKHSSGK